MTKQRIYLSGPITNLRLEDAQALFARAEEDIATLGHIAVNPMKNGLSPKDSWEKHMKKDIVMLLGCDTICLLPNFNKSKGALIELDIATALGMDVMKYDPPFSLGIRFVHHKDPFDFLGDQTLPLASQVDLSEGVAYKAQPSNNNKERQESIVDSIIEEPSRTLNNSRQKPAIPYEKIQHRADFLHNFKDGWTLYNSNALFRTITMLVMNGASVYDLMLELIFMIDGHTTPETSHLKYHDLKTKQEK